MHIPCLLSWLVMSGLLFMACCDWFWYMVIPVFVASFYSYFLAYVKL
jgi:hypothetical protein